jgi:hypothetical protein
VLVRAELEYERHDRGLARVDMCYNLSSISMHVKRLGMVVPVRNDCSFSQPLDYMETEEDENERWLMSIGDHFLSFDPLL